MLVISFLTKNVYRARILDSIFSIKNCLFHDYKPRTEERLSKGRRAFNAVTSVGIKKKGISMKVCSTLFWTIIAPIVTYGCEVWVPRGDELESMRKFQRMIGRRCQRLTSNSPNYSAYLPMGWMSLDRFVQGKNLMFIRTILELKEDATCRRLLVDRSLKFSQDIQRARGNENDSPIFSLLNANIDADLFDTCMNMIHTGRYYTKEQWKKVVWNAMWQKEDEDCDLLYKQGREIPLVLSIIERPYYLIWWIISDKYPNQMRMCEKMAAIVTDSSLLKASDVRLKKKSFWSRTCVKCDLGIVEDAKHITMQCPFYENTRKEMYDEIKMLGCDTIDRSLNVAQNSFHMLLGKQPEDVQVEDMIELCLISGKYITKIYDSVTIG